MPPNCSLSVNWMSCRIPAPKNAMLLRANIPAPKASRVVAVRVRQGFNLSNADSTLQEAGYYRDPADTSQPGVVTVTAAADSINFVVDFAHMHSPCHYYTPPCP